MIPSAILIPEALNLYQMCQIRHSPEPHPCGHLRQLLRNRTGGFLITAGGDRMEAGLGSVESCTIDKGSVPPGIKWLMETYTHGG